jgi:hypothetical protein
MEVSVEPRDYTGDSWERHTTLWNGVYDDVHFSGCLLKDFANFLHMQGGGKSDCKVDPSAKNRPPFPDKDGRYYHTVNDITWTTFVSLSKELGYDGSVNSFYNMTDEIRLKIVYFYLTKVDLTKSELVNSFLSFVYWGSGDYMPLVKRFEEVNGCIHAYLFNEGEYETLHSLLTLRHKQMKGFRKWNEFGRGWASSLAHFHRVFKWYAKT